jgi:NADPH:quinone reductase-like Zn-dependent oxidoreductase
MMGCRVIAVTSKPQGRPAPDARRDHVIDAAETPEWGNAVRDVTGGEGADLIIETGGPDTFEQSLMASALSGRIVLLGTRSARGTPFKFSGDIYARSLATILRVFVGSRASLEAMLKAVAAQRLRPVIDRVFPFAEARAAFSYFFAGDVFGKVVIAGA